MKEESCRPLESEDVIRTDVELETGSSSCSGSSSASCLVVSATLDTGAMVTCVDQRLAVQHSLRKVDADLPMLTWLQDQSIHCYGAYLLPLKFRDSRGEERKHKVLAYGVDKADPPLLIGRHTLKTLGIDIANGTDSWRWGLQATQLSTVSLRGLEREVRNGADAVLVGWCKFTPEDGNLKVFSARAERSSDASGEAPIPPELDEYRDLFDNDSAAMLPEHRSTDHAIQLKDGKEPPFGPLYNLSQRELEVLREYLQKEVERGRITRSTSPAGAPIIFVPKKDGTLRLCVDYRALNAATVKDRCPLPLINETLDRLQGAQFFTTLDLKDAYHRIRIRKGDEWKTAFRTRYGHFEYKVMPFGLTNAPATFQAYINRALSDMLDDVCVVYLDDILIYTHAKDVDEHWAVVKKVLARLREAELFCNLKKCVFAATEVAYLGFRITRKGVIADPAKVATIRDWPAPKNVKELQTFLGFANFYRRFVNNYSLVVRPMTALLKKAAVFRWEDAAEESFQLLKDRFTSTPILRHFDPAKQLKLETDASDFGMSGILSQCYNDGQWHPIAFYSRKMGQAERNWATYDQELGAIVECFKYWRHYFDGVQEPVQVYTDHNNLKSIHTVRQLNARQARWALFLGAFDFQIYHRSGKTNPADGPSRRPDYFTANEAVNQLLPTLQRKLALAEGSGLAQATTGFARVGRECGAVGATTGDPPVTTGVPGRIAPSAAAHNCDNSTVAGATGISQCVPRSVVRVMLNETAPTEAGQPFMELIHQLQQRDNWVADVRHGGKKAGMRGHIWQYDDTDGLLRYRDRVWVPNEPAVRAEVIASHHDSKLAGHFGADRTYELVKRSVGWPALRQDVEEYVRNCPVCQRTKAPRQLPAGQLSSLPIPDNIWEEIALDFIVKLPPTKIRGTVFDSILVVVDRFSKMSLYIPACESWKAPDFASVFFERVVALWGLPKGIVSDRGALFTSAFWTELCFQCQVKRRMSTAYHPQTDGQTERQNQTLEAYLRSFCDTQEDWGMLLPFAQFAYNNTEHSSTGKTPFFVVSGKHPRWNELSHDLHHAGEAGAGTDRLQALEAVRSSAIEHLKKAQEHQQQYYDRKHTPRTFKMGDLVLLSTRNLKLREPCRKLSALFIGPFRVAEAVGAQAYRLGLPPKYRIHDVFHISLLRPYFHRPGEPIANIAEPELAPDGTEVWEVEKILAERKHKGGQQYLLQWKGYNEDNATWEPAENFEEMHDLLEAWQSRKPTGRRTGKKRKRTN